MCLHTEEKRMNICSSQAINSSTIHSSSTTMGSGNGLIDPFPAGLRVLVVDDDLCCLAVLQRKLQKCQYEVTIHNRADVALELLRKDKTGFDIVLSDVHMPDMDGFKLLECVGLEMDLPVIMMSGDDSKDVVMKGVIHGACDYLIKPISIEALKTIWQHVVRKKKKDRKEMEFEQAGIVEDGEQQQNPLEDADYLSSSYEENQKDSNKRKDEAKYTDDDRSTSKKPRVVWSAELHQQFITAVNQIGIDRAVPKKILEVMNVPGLARENVASHLQKFRLYLRKLSTSSQHQNGLDNSFMGPGDVPFGSISSFNGLGLQTLAAPGQMIHPPSLATIQAASLSKVTPKSAISLPLIDQRYTFSYENKKSRFGEGLTQLNDNNKQMKLFHGIPTNMEPKQLAASLHQYTDTFGNGSHVSGISPYFGQPALSQSFPGGVHTRSEFDNVSGALFNPISHTSKGALYEQVKSDTKDSRGFLANFGDFTDLNQNENRDQGLYNRGPIFEPTQHSNTSQQVNSSLADNAKSGAGKLPDMGFLSTPFLEQFNQDDFWSLILQQPEDGIGLVEGEFGSDGYHLENLPA